MRTLILFLALTSPSLFAATLDEYFDLPGFYALPSYVCSPGAKAGTLDIEPHEDGYICTHFKQSGREYLAIVEAGDEELKVKYLLEASEDGIESVHPDSIIRGV